MFPLFLFQTFSLESHQCFLYHLCSFSSLLTSAYAPCCSHICQRLCKLSSQTFSGHFLVFSWFSSFLPLCFPSHCTFVLLLLFFNMDDSPLFSDYDSVFSFENFHALCLFECLDCCLPYFFSCVRFLACFDVSLTGHIFFTFARYQILRIFD